MTSIQNSTRRPIASSGSVPTNQSSAIAQVVGLVCIVGFIVDVAILAFPPSFGNVQWRIGILQQIGDRSIVLLLGTALLLFANQGIRKIRKPIALLSLSVGAFFLLSSLVAVKDGVSLNKTALESIDTQAVAIQEQIEQAKLDASLAPDVTPEQMQQAERQLQLRSQALQKQAKVGVLKRSSSSVGNLVITGLGLIFLGRIGGRSPRNS